MIRRTRNIIVATDAQMAVAVNEEISSRARVLGK
jgi:hypothetical protein